MSEENTQEVTAAPEDAPQDWFLESLVRLANRFHIEIGVTLTVGGTLISGQLVSGKVYFEEMARAIKDNFPEDLGDVGEYLSEAIKDNGELYPLYVPPTNEGNAVDNEAKEGVADELPPISFIHLRKAHYLQGAGAPIPTGEGVFWRGRLSCVDGFSLGVFSTGTR